MSCPDDPCNAPCDQPCSTKCCPAECCRKGWLGTILCTLFVLACFAGTSFLVYHWGFTKGWHGGYEIGYHSGHLRGWEEGAFSCIPPKCSHCGKDCRCGPVYHCDGLKSPGTPPPVVKPPAKTPDCKKP